jgi:biopolymer transport protein ExbB/TolQ
MTNPSMRDKWVMGAVRCRLKISENQARAELSRRLCPLATIASTAPLVGLFGTTIGIMAAFKGCGAQQVYCMAATCDGLSEALVSTALALSVAVAASWSYNYFVSRLETLTFETSNACLELETFLTFRLSHPNS